MPATASDPNSGMPTVSQAYGNSGKHNRRMPYVPSFNSTPALLTLPAVGASVCASGSHVCSGNTGTLTMKPTDIARNSAICTFCGSGFSVVQRASAENEVGRATPDDHAGPTRATDPG